MSGSAWEGRGGGARRSGGTEGLINKYKHVSTRFCPSPSLSLAKWLDYITKTSAKGFSLIGPLPYAWLKLQGPTIKTPRSSKQNSLFGYTDQSVQSRLTDSSQHTLPQFPLRNHFCRLYPSDPGAEHPLYLPCPGNKSPLC